MWSAVLKIHQKGDATVSWGMNKSVIVDITTVWYLEPENKWQPFLDHDMDPSTPLVFPPGAEGTVQLWKKSVMGDPMYVTKNHFSVED
jgi:hypothetical protein